MEPEAAERDLAAIDLLAVLRPGELARWAASAQERRIAAGGLIAEQGLPAPGLILVLDGTVEALLVDGARAEPVGRAEAPTWTAGVSVLTGAAMPVRIHALTDVRLAVIPAGTARRLARRTPAVEARILATVAPAIGRVARVEAHRDRLAATSTIAAGMAHELNNPASAADRSAALISQGLASLIDALARMVDGDASVAAAVASAREVLARPRRPGPADTAADDAADEVADALRGLGVADPWELGDELVARGLDVAWVARVAGTAGPSAAAALELIASAAVVDGLATELRDATTRVAELVAAMSGYASLNRGDVAMVDVHASVDATLRVLAPRLAAAPIDVVRAYDADLPPLVGHGAELSQLWTELIGNAIDALGPGGGAIRISTRRAGGWAEIAISDDGPGIPDALQPHVFDEFLTTRDVGRGTGLGLATARRIAVDLHRGSLTLDASAPTTFRVRLPLPAAPPR